MIFGEMAILLNLLSIMAFGVLLIIGAVSIFIKVKLGNLSHYTASSRRRMLWLLALSPWLVGLLAATLALLSGSQYMPILDIYDLFHWHHPQEFSFNSWHGLSLGFAISCAGFLVIRSVKSLLLNNHQITLLRALAERDENNVFQLDADTPTAFTAGYYQPQSYMTSALRRQLNHEEYTIIQLHENAHAKRSDPLKKWFFQLISSFFPLGISRQLNQAMTLAMEQCADADVSKVVTDKSKIALTLLKVKRLSVGAFASILDNDSIDHQTVCYFGSNHQGVDNLSERISYLLSDDQRAVFPILWVILAALSMSLLCAMSANLFHHAIEFTISH